MSAEDITLYREGIAAFNRGDLDWLLARLAPEFEFVAAGVLPDTDGTYAGPEGLRRFFAIFVDGPWEELAITAERVEDLGGGRVAALLSFRGIGRGSGAVVEMPYGHICTLRDGKISRLEGFATWDETLEAAGLGSR